MYNNITVPREDLASLINELELFKSALIQDKDPVQIKGPRIALKGNDESIRLFVEAEDLSWHYEKELLINGRSYYIAYDFDVSR